MKQAHTFIVQVATQSRGQHAMMHIWKKKGRKCAPRVSRIASLARLYSLLIVSVLGIYQDCVLCIMMPAGSWAKNMKSVYYEQTIFIYFEVVYKGASPGLPDIAGDRAPRRPLNG